MEEHRAGLAASGQRSDLTGWVRITASDIMFAQLLPEIIATNGILDLMRREADVAAMDGSLRQC